MSTEKSLARRTLERITGGPLTLPRLLAAIREGEGWSQTEMADRLQISRSHLCDVEKGRKAVAPERAARWARELGFGEEQFVRLALQQQVDAAGLDLQVSVHR